MSSEPKPQLLFDGHLIFTSAPKKAKKLIKDIVSWMEAFTIFSLVFGNSFSASLERLVPVSASDPTLLSAIWLAYDRALQEHKAATNLVDW